MFCFCFGTLPVARQKCGGDQQLRAAVVGCMATVWGIGGSAQLNVDGNHGWWRGEKFGALAAAHGQTLRATIVGGAAQGWGIGGRARPKV